MNEFDLYARISFQLAAIWGKVKSGAHYWYDNNLIFNDLCPFSSFIQPVRLIIVRVAAKCLVFVDSLSHYTSRRLCTFPAIN
jgi:hypothetical protein